jgi:hypothetical protein
MPDRRTHKLISKLITGYECDKTHSVIDYPVRYLRKDHRILFHDPFSAFLIGYLCNGPEGAVSGIAHVVTDYLVSEAKKKV